MERNICFVCSHTMPVVNGKLECAYCAVFYNFDISKAWLEYLYNKEHEEEKRETINRKTTGFFKSIV